MTVLSSQIYDNLRRLQEHTNSAQICLIYSFPGPTNNDDVWASSPHRRGIHCWSDSSLCKSKHLTNQPLALSPVISSLSAASVAHEYSPVVCQSRRDSDHHRTLGRPTSRRSKRRHSHSRCHSDATNARYGRSCPLKDSSSRRSELRA